MDELVSIINFAEVCVFPILSGSGTKLKIIESLAAGRPVITTSKGVEGLDLENGKDLIIENNIEKYPEIIENLLKNKMKGKGMGLHGQNTIRKYSWKNIVEIFLKRDLKFNR